MAKEKQADFKKRCEKADDAYLGPIFDLAPEHFTKILKNHVLPTIVNLDNKTRILEYDKTIGLEAKFNGVYLDHEMIVPSQVSIHKWFTNDFERVKQFRTLKYMTHVVNTDLLEQATKEKYLDFIDYSDRITQVAKDEKDPNADSIFVSLQMPEG